MGMSKYAPNEPGITALKSMAVAIAESNEQIQMLTSNIQSTADEYNDTLGPHKASLDGALENINESLKQASDPANNVAEILNEVAEAYQEIVDNDRIKASLGKN